VARRRLPAHRATRVVRGGLLTIGSAGLAMTAHGLAGGGLLDSVPALPLTFLLATVGTTIADRWRGESAMLAVLGFTELGQHVLLSISHGQHAARPDPILMAAAHAAATLVTAALLAGANTAITTVVSSLAALLPDAPPTLVPRATKARRPIAMSPHSHLLHVLLRRMSARRGPPRAC